MMPFYIKNIAVILWKIKFFMKKYCEKRKCQTLICPNCGQSFLKPLSEINRNEKLNRLNFCSIACALSYRNKYNLSEKSKQNQINFKKNYTGIIGENNPSSKKYKDTLPFRETFRKAKMHSKEKNREFTITIEDIERQWNLQNGKCVYTNIDLELPTYKYTPKLTRMASLDRIDPKKGYIPGNIQFVVSCINLMKNKLSDLEVKTFLKEISTFTSSFELD